MSTFSERLAQKGACERALHWVGDRDLETCLRDESCPYAAGWFTWLAACSRELYSMVLRDPIVGPAKRKMDEAVGEADTRFYDARDGLRVENHFEPIPREEIERLEEIWQQEVAPDTEAFVTVARAWALDHLAELEQMITGVVPVLP